MISRLFTILAGALWLTGCGAPDALEAQEWPEPAPAIWEVSSSDGATGWLFGTVHALPDGVEWQSRPVDTAFSQAGVLVVEIADLGAEGVSAQAYRAVAYDDGLAALTRRFDAEDRDQIEGLLERTGLDEAEFDGLETWAAALVLSRALSQGDPANGVDRALMAAGTPVVGMESYSAQFALFDELPAGEQNDLVLAVAAEGDPQNVQDMLRAWLTGDIERLEQTGAGGLLADRELREALVDNRNRAWIPQIRALLDDGRRPFVAVGAGHMLGQQGLPALLAAQGYTVERIQ